MSDLVVTVPKWFWNEWIAEGDAAGEPETGQEWCFSVGARPPIKPGERLYIVAHNRLRGFAPVVRIEHLPDGRWAIVRKGGAIACTVPFEIPGFRGFRRVWWRPEAERPFPNWKTEGVRV